MKNKIAEHLLNKCRHQIFEYNVLHCLCFPKEMHSALYFLSLKKKMSTRTLNLKTLMNKISNQTVVVYLNSSIFRNKHNFGISSSH